MKYIIRYILIISALIPATILLGFSFYALGKVLVNLDKVYKIKYFSLLLTSSLGILGYCGLFMLLTFYDKINPKRALLFLICGIISFVIFTSMGGVRAWLWVITMEEPDEWFIFVWPTVVSIYFTINIFKTMYNNT
jgi:hypothetical protein